MRFSVFSSSFASKLFLSFIFFCLISSCWMWHLCTWSCCFCSKTRNEPERSRPPVSDVQPLCECTSVTLSSFDPLCCSSFFFFFCCDKRAYPLDPPGGLRMAVSHEPFWQAHFEGFRMWWQGVLATRTCVCVCVCMCLVSVCLTVYLRGWRGRGIESDWQTIWAPESLPLFAPLSALTVLHPPPHNPHTPSLPLRLCEPPHNAGTLKWQ